MRYAINLWKEAIENKIDTGVPVGWLKTYCMCYGIFESFLKELSHGWTVWKV